MLNVFQYYHMLTATHPILGCLSYTECDTEKIEKIIQSRNENIATHSSFVLLSKERPLFLVFAILGQCKLHIKNIERYVPQ